MAKQRVSKFSTFTKGHEEETHYVGLDVHKHQIHLAVWRAGESATTVCNAAPATVVATLARLGVPIGAVAYESGPTGHGLARELTLAGHNCIMTPSVKVMRPVSRGAKTDRLDCIKLAELAAKGMLVSCYTPTPEEESVRNIVRRREGVKKELHRTMQRIKSQLLCLGIEEPPEIAAWSGGAVAALEAIELSGGNRFMLQGLTRDYLHLRSEMNLADAELARAAEERSGSEMRRLTSIPGVAKIAAATFLLEIADRSRFEGPEQVASFVGLAPVVRQSGESSGTCALTPKGQNGLRSVLIQAAWQWMRRDRHAARLYEKLKRNTGMWQKAICALARKLVIVMWTLLEKDRMYWVVEA